MKKQYDIDRKMAIEQLIRTQKDEILTEEKLSALPKAIQKHFRLSGFVGKSIAMNGDVIWKESYLKLKPTQNWKPLKTWQFNSVLPIMRTSYMKVDRMFFAGKDLYKEGKGTMIGKILGFIPIINAHGQEISQSALVTSFCEMMLLSGYAFQEYVEWNPIDHRTVEAKLTDHGMTVCGKFHFDEEGKFESFETDERFFEKEKNVYEKRKFLAKVHRYKKVDNYYQPEKVSVIWVLDDGEFEYFKGIIDHINYHVKA